MVTKIYSGTRWQIFYGSFEGIERFALCELQRCLQSFLPYLLPVLPADSTVTAGHLALLGTAENNRQIASLIDGGMLAAPTGREGYSIAVLPSPWQADCRLLVIAGADPSGVLYGVEEFNARHMYRGTRLEGQDLRRKYLDEIVDFRVCESPAVQERGIWSWGYVIYDYRRFFDNMARLKMNMLTMWNDQAPLNLAEILDYAHARGIQVIAGFHWGWGLDSELDLTRAEDRGWIKEHVVRTFHNQYAHTAVDGIYFQTLTEHATQEIHGRSVAAWACELVNDVSAALLADYPALSIQFGLHATSIGNHYVELAGLDPRVIITWEDAGALPFGYHADPVTGEATAESTREYAKQLAVFRPGSTFAMVPKGWMFLRWGIDFENHGPFLLGERDARDIRERLHDRQGELDERNQEWFQHYPLAARFYRDVLAVNPRMLVTGLVEDGVFEARIQPGVALFAEMLWNPQQTDADLLARAMRPYYREGNGY